jgi:hypothetical protein
MTPQDLLAEADRLLTTVVPAPEAAGHEPARG